MQSRILRTPDAAAYIGLAASTLEKMRLTGDGPRFIRLGPKAVGYDRADLDHFIEAGRRSSTSEDPTPNQEVPSRRSDKRIPMSRDVQER